MPRPLATTTANGTNLYSLSALMGSHVKRRSYHHKASGFCPLCPSHSCLPAEPCACKGRRSGDVVIGWFEGVFLFSLTLPPSSHEAEVMANQTLLFSVTSLCKSLPSQ